MKDYLINIFYSDEDKCYIADVPDLRFCSAHGPAPERALKEVQIAKGLWLEVAREKGLPIPAPRTRPKGFPLAPEKKPKRSSARDRARRDLAGP